jgi:hypothetical protein
MPHGWLTHQAGTYNFHCSQPGWSHCKSCKISPFRLSRLYSTDSFKAIQRWKSSLDGKYQSLFERVYAVVFCGTPHRGSNAAEWGLLGSNIVAAAFQDSNTTLLSDLRVDGQILDLIQEDFLKTLHPNRIKVHSFQEGRPFAGIKFFNGKVCAKSQRFKFADPFPRSSATSLPRSAMLLKG